MREWLRRRCADEDGQGLMEYALIGAFVSIMCVAALQTIGGGLSASLLNSATTMFP